MTQTAIIEAVASMNNEQQNNFYNELIKNGFSLDEVNTIKQMAFFHKLYNDNYLYNTVVKAMAKEIYKELN